MLNTLTDLLTSIAVRVHPPFRYIKSFSCLSHATSSTHGHGGHGYGGQEHGDMDMMDMDMANKVMVDMDTMDMDMVDISKSRTFPTQFGLVCTCFCLFALAS